MSELIKPTESLTGEIWKPVPGFEQDYEVSNRGRICSHRKGHTRILKPILEKWNGYFVVSLFDAEGRMHKAKVHRLVALAFIPNPHGYPCVNHKDEDKTNNHTDKDIRYKAEETVVNHERTYTVHDVFWICPGCGFIITL